MAASLFDLTGKVALVTGATRGIGLSIAAEMARAGAQVIISSNEPRACEEVSDDLRRQGLDAIGIACDVGVRAQLESLVNQALSQRPRIDVLVCNAGVAPHAGPIASATDADWDLTMTVNLRSALWLTSLVIPGMAQLARNLAVEWGPSNIRVNAISPGLIATEFARPLTGNETLLARRLSGTPLRRVGESDEIAGVAVMLAARAGAFITGQNLIVDGGTLISDGN